MATQTAVKRLSQDFKRLKRDPVPYVIAAPMESNILEWRYCVQGPPETPYNGGYYHGKLVFPSDFPFRPPKITMITPSGRFETNKRLCLSISDFHPDTWNPAWSVATILTGLLSFMVETAPTVGSVTTSDETKRRLAIQSWYFNLNDSTFCKMFPELAKEIQDKIDDKERRDDEEQDRLEALKKKGQTTTTTLPPVETNYWFSIFSDLVIKVAPFILFFTFAYIVQLVIKSS